MIEKLFFLLNRLPESVVWLIAFSIIVTSTGIFFKENLWFGIFMGFTAVPIGLYIEAISRSPKFLGKIISKRTLVALVIGTFFIVLAILLVILLLPTIPKDTRIYSLSIPFFVVGIILGIILRQYCGKLVFDSLSAKKRLGTNVLIIAIWSIIVILLPWSDHVVVIPWYIIGIGIGILGHKGSRLWSQQMAESYRRIQNIADAWLPKAKMGNAEFDALRLLVKGRQLPCMKFKKLRGKINNWKTSKQMTKRLYEIKGDGSLYLENIYWHFTLKRTVPFNYPPGQAPWF